MTLFLLHRTKQQNDRCAENLFYVQSFGKFKVTHFQNSDHILIDRSTWEEITALKKILANFSLSLF